MTAWQRRSRKRREGLYNNAAILLVLHLYYFVCMLCVQSLLLHGLARSRVAFKSATLTAIITVALRPLIAADFSGNFLSLFNLHILSVPAVIQHMSELAADVSSAHFSCLK